jgi:Nrap protein domain 6
MELSFINPLQMYIDELKRHFDDVAMFFTDVYGGDKIAVVWKSGQLEDTGFKVNVGYNAMPTTQLIVTCCINFRMGRL